MKPKRFIGLLLLQLGFIIDLAGQSLTRFEYFFDVDPGTGNGNPIIVSTSDSVSINVPVLTTGLSAGNHKVGIRAMNNNGEWGHAEFRNLFILELHFPAPDSLLLTAEYFYNSDPGIGNATSITFTTGNPIQVDIPIDITGLGDGVHTVGLRFKNQHGDWGFTEFRKLFIQASLADSLNQEITSGEFYYGDTIPPHGGGYPFPVSTIGDSVTVEIPDTLENLAMGQHKIHIRFKNAKNVWSHQESLPFTVCSSYGPVSEFYYQIEGNKVFFTNASADADSVLWKFGDNTTDTSFSPIKTYLSAGVFNVELITKNVCGADTIVKQVVIRGLQRVNPAHAGNAGVSSLMFEGFGFTPSTEIKLVLGAQSFIPVSKTLLNSNRIRAIFDLTGMAPGQYHAVALVGGPFDTLNNGVTIENNIDISLTLSQTSRTFFRPGNGFLASTLQNHGSHDAVMVPYIAAMNIKPGTVVNQNFNSLMDFVFLPPEGIFQHTFQYLNSNQVPLGVMEENILDSLRGRHLIAYYKVKIPGHSSTTEIARNANSTPFAYQAGSIVQPELMDSYALLGEVNTEVQACYSTFLKHQVEKYFSSSINQADWETCFNPAFDTLMGTLAAISQNPLLENFAVPMPAAFSALLAKMAECTGSGIPAGLGGIDFKRIIQGVMNNWIFQEDIDSLHVDCIDTTVLFSSARMREIVNGSRTGESEAFDCSDCPGASIFPEMCETCGPILKMRKAGKKNKVLKRQFGLNSAVVGCQEWCENTSADPNVKYGPGNNDDRKYINHIKDISYTIAFENLATATAPAAFVEIRDTIDKTVFDISTLQLGLVSWGDSVITIEPNRTNHSILKDLRPVHPNFLRIDMTMDTLTAELRWRFWTVDTVTLQLTQEVTEGFLPPNTDGKSGAGFVSFNIRPLETVTNGTVLMNDATIVFDNNAPINTGIWEHRIDTLPPVSQVNSLPASVSTSQFNVTWAGSDGHSGIDLYSVYVSVNDSTYKLWRSLVSTTSDVFTGVMGNTYKFISIALDRAGNFEEPPQDPINNPDAMTTINDPLPLLLLDFEVQKVYGLRKAAVKWITELEVNLSHFEIQRSENGMFFETIGRVNARNLATVNVYSWNDEQVLNGLNYYRLKIVNLDGSIEFSPVRLLRFVDLENILVFPTVTDGPVFIQSPVTINIELINIVGVVIKKRTVRGNEMIDLSKYASGVYFIRDVNNNKTYKIFRQ